MALTNNLLASYRESSYCAVPIQTGLESTPSVWEDSNPLAQDPQIRTNSLMFPVTNGNR